jgi:predicted nucleotide-binding protein
MTDHRQKPPNHAEPADQIGRNTAQFIQVQASYEDALASVTADRDLLRDALVEARDQIVALREEIEVLQARQDRTGIFVVHGHDDRLKIDVVRMLELATDQEVTILAERPTRGQTVIEKLERYSSVGFAVVLLTPDDQVVPSKSAASVGRARQNVILELGLFLGLIGRDRVCVLYKPGVEIPSDYSGILLIEADEGGLWKFNLARELEAAGIRIDWPRIR